MTTPQSPTRAVARLALGSAQFGLAYGVSNTAGKMSADAASRLLAAAYGAGVDMLDTAAAYGDAEEAIALAAPPAARFRIVSKTAPLAEGLDRVVARARRSAELAGGALDALLVHDASDLAGPDGAALWSALERLRAEGVARRIGFSAYASDEPEAIADRYHPDVVQLPLSVLDQRLAGAIERLAERDVEVHARSIFLQGLVFLPPERVPPSLASAAGPRLAGFRAELDRLGFDPLGAALGYAITAPGVARIVVGVASAGELREILAALERPAQMEDWSGFAIDDPLVVTPSLWGLA